MAKYSLSNNQITELKLSVNPPIGVLGYQRPLKPIQVMEYIDLLKNKNIKHLSIVEDAMDFIKDLDNEYDIIVLDPPAFAKHIKVCFV